MAPYSVMFLLAIILWPVIPPASPWIIPQPRANVWRTLANTLGQEHICLSMASAEDPMSTCLVGIPLSPDELPSPFNSSLVPFVTQTLSHRRNPSNVWRDGIKGLAPLTSEPPELDLLGSTNASLCFLFWFSPVLWDSRYTRIKPIKNKYVAAQWCETAVEIPIASTLGSEPLSLPWGIFFICGDRAWAGIPSRLVGGPCTLGQLSLFTPNLTKINDWKVKRAPPESVWSKRDLKDLDPECDSETIHWSKPKIVAVTLFLPWVSVAKSLGELARLECWVAKQANLTSATLSDLLSDEEIMRKATLQNRAAIDFLLLLHNHRCGEFEGLCCLNLSSWAEDARASIQKMQDMVHQIKQDTSDWLGDLFKNWGLSGWIGSILKTALLVLLVILAVSVASTVVWRLVKGLLVKLTSPPNVNQVSAEEEGQSIELQDAEDLHMDSELEGQDPQDVC
ncbi:uncharacterized protein LOC118693622 [Molothrus ater]|uniref:uncharacterized protein LOC118693622 n=1 Tax=Molothrus ater TaxID=84834 RepID=UPI00174A9074|nr:uncharacterized protein LOC118693622 [Molothrus ater]